MADQVSQVAEASSPFADALRPDTPAPASRWSAFPQYNFVGGHNAPEAIPTADFQDALQKVLAREGRTLATYSLESGPQGYLPLRTFLSDKLERNCGIAATPDDILMVSGSLQGMDLINAALLSRGDTVIIEAANYGGVLSRLSRLGVKAVGVPLDSEGMRTEALREALSTLKSRGVTPKYIYTIPTVQNPTATILPERRRAEMRALAAEFNTTIFEDDCYADLVFDGDRPPAIYAGDTDGRVVYLGSFSKSLAPALRVGYVVAPWPLLSRLLALKTDAGSGALEQMMLAEYCADRFDTHVANLNAALKAKSEVLTATLGEQFGTAAEFETPRGGIFLWVTLPETVDTTALAARAGELGIAVNPGAEWSIEPDARRKIRICYANPDADTIKAGVAKLADVCFEMFGVPERSGNTAR
ncbi:MAG: PLP-dependent aminotransferase family protein [Pseudomonadota bacterium]